MKPRFRFRIAAAMLLSTLLVAFAGGCQTAATPKDTAVVDQVDMRVGDGAAAEAGRTLTVNYTGWLYDESKPDKKGKTFDTSIGKEPFSFVLGQAQVIKGWDQGVVGMKVGGQRRLVIPASLAYGSAGAGDVIPPDATLIFDVDLLRVN